MDQQCLSRVHARFEIDLHPSKLHNVEEGVHEHLNGVLFRYQDDLEGFVMAYENVKILSKHASIHPYFPLVHVEVKAQVLLFKPTVGCMLVGRVIKVATDFIGLLVLGIFNASIAADSIRSEFKYSMAAQSWASKKNPEHKLTVGMDVRFQVVKLQEQAVFFGIFGSLADKSTGAVEYLLSNGRLTAAPDKAPAEANGAGSAEKAQKKEKGKAGAGAGADAGGLEKKKKKKSKGKEEEAKGHAVANGLTTTPADGKRTKGEDGKKEKKKRKLEA